MRKGPSRGQVKAQKLRGDWALLIAVTAAVLAGAALSWYRLLVGHGSLDDAYATEVAQAVASAARGNPTII